MTKKGSNVLFLLSLLLIADIFSHFHQATTTHRALELNLHFNRT